MTDTTPEHPTPKTSTALTFTQPKTPHERYIYAQSLAPARSLPGELRGSVADVLLRIEYGVAVGIPPISAVNSVHVIEGKPAASAALISGLLRKAGRLRLTTAPDEKYPGEVKAVATYVRYDDPDFEYRVEWTIDRAIEAELMRLDANGKPEGIPSSKGKASNWSKYRPAMLKARAVSEIGRDAAEDVLLGIHYTPEELGAVVNADGDPLVIDGEVVVEPVRNYVQEAAAAEPAVDVTAERLEEVRALILAAWQDGNLDNLTAVFRGPVREYDLAATLEVETLEEVNGTPTGEVVTLEELFRRVGTAIRNGVPAPTAGDEDGPADGDGPSGGSAAPTGPAAPPTGDGGETVDGDVVDGELVTDGEPWPETRQAPADASPLDLPIDPEARALTAEEVAAALGGTILSPEEVARLEGEHYAAQVGERLRSFASDLTPAAPRGTEAQRRAYETGPAAARAALEAARRSRAGA